MVMVCLNILGEFHTHISKTVSHGDLLDGLRGGRVGRPRHSGVVVGVGVHRVRVRRQSPISTKRFSQNELVI